MLTTIEIRWFYAGTIPEEALAWFQASPRQADVQPRRDDLYLVLPECDSLGIKLRQGRIEIKQRYQQFDAVRIHDRVAGAPQLWRKWSFQLDQADGALAGIPLQSLWWIPVRKERLVRIYRIIPGGTMFAVPAGEYPERGCQLELTQVHLRGKAWWTFGFEAFGDESTLYGDLLHVATHTLAAGEPPLLSSGDCYSYPQWLQTIGHSLKE